MIVTSRREKLEIKRIANKVIVILHQKDTQTKFLVQRYVRISLSHRMILSILLKYISILS